ncbi:MAG: hypothetical protein ACI3W7_09280 [Oscillospiraceae bacterium]
MDPKDSKSVQEKLAVYDTLRDSIISCENRMVNEKIYMYIVYFTLLTLGYDHTWAILVSYLVLIVFQSLINEEAVAVEKASTYIRIFFEKDMDIHWETLHKNELFLSKYLPSVRTIGQYIENHGASILAIISFLVLLTTSLQQYSFLKLPSELVVELILSVILCVAVIYINKNLYINNGDTGSDLETGIVDFYNTVCKH